MLYLLFSILALLSTSGCSAVGMLAYKVAGPQPIAPKYTPDQTPMLVFVENHSQPSATVGPDVLARYVIEDLQENKTAPIIPAERLQELRDSKMGEFHNMSVTSIGKALGASQVLWIVMEEDDVTALQGEEETTGHGFVNVKLIDVATGQMLWPKDQASGYTLSASTKLGLDSNHASANEVHRRIYASLATQIGKLFHKWTPENEMPQE